MIKVPQIAGLASKDPILYEALRQIAMLAGPDEPAGLIRYCASSTIPEGFLLADGRSLRRADVPRLFAAIGTRYGNGDGVTTFNIPDVPSIAITGKPALVGVIKL